MKASELVKKLQELIEEHGDKEVRTASEYDDELSAYYYKFHDCFYYDPDACMNDCF